MSSSLSPRVVVVGVVVCNVFDACVESGAAGRSSFDHPCHSTLPDAWSCPPALVCPQLWKEFEGIPEIFDIATMKAVHYAKDAPLRPELLESTFVLYSLTRDESYLHAGASIMAAINSQSRVRCGFASVADVQTKRLDDRMDSYFLAETTKYLFLLFDSALMPSGHLPLYSNRTHPLPSAFMFADVAASPSPTSATVTMASAPACAAPSPPSVSGSSGGSQCIVQDAVLGCGRSDGAAAAASDSNGNNSSGAAQRPSRHVLASTVRSKRTPIPALPFDPLRVRARCVSRCAHVCVCVCV